MGGDVQWKACAAGWVEDRIGQYGGQGKREEKMCIESIVQHAQQIGKGALGFGGARRQGGWENDSQEEVGMAVAGLGG